ncbi:hypothetical protein N9L26_02045 [Candidatus Pacebacteria bacterium]|nr:hypothetical protein [Candidatus Paceibacterota bacterium]
MQTAEEEAMRREILDHPTVVTMDKHDRRDLERNTGTMRLSALGAMLEELDEPDNLTARH